VPRRGPGPAAVSGDLTWLSPAGIAGHEDRRIIGIATDRMLAGIAATPTARRLVCRVVRRVAHPASVSLSGSELALLASFCAGRPGRRGRALPALA
jgi:hypothetical protein